MRTQINLTQFPEVFVLQENKCNDRTNKCYIRTHYL